MIIFAFQSIYYLENCIKSYYYFIKKISWQTKFSQEEGISPRGFFSANINQWKYPVKTIIQILLPTAYFLNFLFTDITLRKCFKFLFEEKLPLTLYAFYGIIEIFHNLPANEKQVTYYRSVFSLFSDRILATFKLIKKCTLFTPTAIVINKL